MSLKSLLGKHEIWNIATFNKLSLDEIITKRIFVHSGDDDSVMDVCDFSNNKAAMKTVIKVSSTNNKTAGDGRGGSGSEASPRDSGNGSAFSDISMTSATSASKLRTKVTASSPLYEFYYYISILSNKPFLLYL